MSHRAFHIFRKCPDVPQGVATAIIAVEKETNGISRIAGRLINHANMTEVVDGDVVPQPA